MNNRTSPKSKLFFRIVCSFAIVFVLIASFLRCLIYTRHIVMSEKNSEIACEELNEAFDLYYQDMLSSCKSYALKMQIRIISIPRMENIGSIRHYLKRILYYA